nr:hypothetical protein [Paraburkholderia sp.]
MSVARLAWLPEIERETAQYPAALIFDRMRPARAQTQRLDQMREHAPVRVLANIAREHCLARRHGGAAGSGFGSGQHAVERRVVAGRQTRGRDRAHASVAIEPDRRYDDIGRNTLNFAAQHVHRFAQRRIARHGGQHDVLQRQQVQFHFTSSPCLLPDELSPCPRGIGNDIDARIRHAPVRAKVLLTCCPSVMIIRLQSVRAHAALFDAQPDAVRRA